MSSEGKLLAPKPIRRSAIVPALKYSKSIGCPAKNTNFDLFSNSKFSEFTKELPKMASNCNLANDNSAKNSENEVPNGTNFISYEEFESEINADVSNQFATSEILAILSNSKKTKLDSEIISPNKNENYNNRNKNNLVINKNKYQNNYEKSEFSVHYPEKNSPLKKYKLSLDNDTAINLKANTAENSNGKNNFLINPKNNYTNEYNKNNPSPVSPAFSKTKKESDIVNLDKILTCVDIAEKKENSSNSEYSNCNNKNLSSNVQQPKINLINDLNINQPNANRPISPISTEKASDSYKIKNEKPRENLFGEEENLNFEWSNDILYFLDQNFFLELEKENYSETFNFPAYPDQRFGKFDSFSTRLRKTTSNPIPIRCTNPFEKNLSAEGCKKIRKFLAEEIEINDVHLKSEDLRLYNTKPDFIENFLFSEPQTLKVRK